MRKRLTPILLLFCISWLISADIYPAETPASTPPEPPLRSALMGLSLEECIRLAAVNSFEVKLAQLDFLIAEQDLPADEAIYDTVLSLDASYEKDKREPLSILAADESQTNKYSLEATKELPTGTELTLSLSDERNWSNSGYTATNPAHTAELSFEIRQPLGKNTFGLVDRGNISVTKLAIENADLDTKERIETLFADVERAYWEWVLAKRSHQIHCAFLEKAKELHQSNAKKFDTGLIEKAELLASKANVLLREKDVLIVQNQYRRAEEKIKLLINLDIDLRIQPKADLAYSRRELALEDCLRIAFDIRRDYLQAKTELKMKEITLKTKANECWPEVDLVASFAANGIDAEFGRALNDITTGGDSDYYLGLEISIPIENNSAQSELEKARHKKEKALISLKNLERTIVTEVTDAYRDYLTYQTNLSKIGQAARLQAEKLQEENARYSFGRSNTKRLIDYQEDVLQAQLEEARAIAELEAAWVSLEQALNIILVRCEGIL